MRGVTEDSVNVDSSVDLGYAGAGNEAARDSAADLCGAADVIKHGRFAPDDECEWLVAEL